MSKNYWGEVTKILCVEFGEDFELLDCHQNIAYKGLFHFSEYGLFDFCGGIRIGLLESNLSGSFTIKKLPWKPEDKEIFWYADIDGCVWNGKYSANLSLDRLRYKSGNCFKTQEEAEQNANRIVTMLASDELFIESN